MRRCGLKKTDERTREMEADIPVAFCCLLCKKCIFCCFGSSTRRRTRGGSDGRCWYNSCSNSSVRRSWGSGGVVQIEEFFVLCSPEVCVLDAYECVSRTLFFCLWRGHLLFLIVAPSHKILLPNFFLLYDTAFASSLSYSRFLVFGLTLAADTTFIPPVS